MNGDSDIVKILRWLFFHRLAVEDELRDLYEFENKHGEFEEIRDLIIKLEGKLQIINQLRDYVKFLQNHDDTPTTFFEEMMR